MKSFRLRFLRLNGLLGILSISAVRLASAQTAPGLGETSADPAGSVDRRVEMWRLEMGYRGSIISSAGYDPFSNNDLLPQLSLAGSRTVISVRTLSLAAGFAWDHGYSASTARGDATSFATERFTVPIEGRMHFGRWGYAFLRGAPGALSLHAQVDDASAPAPLSKTRWLLATDVSAGYAWLVWPQTLKATREPFLWLQADVGYGWVAGERLDLGPTLASGDQRLASGLDLGSISLSGPFFRVAAAVSF